MKKISNLIIVSIVLCILMPILFIVFIWIPIQGVDIDIMNNSPLTIKVKQIGFTGWGISMLIFRKQNGDELWRFAPSERTMETTIEYGNTEEGATESTEASLLPISENVVIDIYYMADLPMPGGSRDRYIFEFQPDGTYKAIRLTSHYNKWWENFL